MEPRLFALLALLAPTAVFAQAHDFVTAYNVTWASPGTNENDSMPVGNGDLAANVWTEANGDLVLLVAKSDALSEWGKFVKLGRVRVQLSPNPFVGTSDFTQALHLENGSIEIKSGDNRLQVWVDANHPIIHVEADLAKASTLSAKLELWRTTKPDQGGMFELGGHFPIETATDTVFPASGNQLTWCHFNPSSVYPTVMKQEHLEALAQKYPDPLLHRCFGAALSGSNLTNSDDHTLQSSAPGKYFQMSLTALTETSADSPQTWQNHLQTLVEKNHQLSLRQLRAEHEEWWHNFWDRSWLQVTGTPDAERVTQGYLMQRYMVAASSRGALPAKFNGGLFTVGHDLPIGQESKNEDHSPDYRAWGNSYWNQNNRLLYWPLLTTGDFDLIQPWFALYTNALPLAEDRTRLYFHHDGASFPETMLFWGVPNLNDFGWNNPSVELRSNWQRYHVQGSLEIIAQMLDQYAITQNTDFARTSLIPFADTIVTYFGQHWPRDAAGKIHMAPAQSLETYQLDAVNPTPDVAGLKSVLPRLLALPDDLTLPSQRDSWRQILKDLPPLPVGKTVHGKLADYGQGDTDGKAIILPAEKYGKPSNSENPELYVAFPYRLFGVGKPNLTLAQNTFAARRYPQDTCWGQDGPQAAVLGLTSAAKKAAIAEFTDYGDQRFPWFWKAGHDWIPDFDNGGTGMITLQLMLMQCDGKRIQLMPAWPKDWTAHFKLHAPYQTTIEGSVQNGYITDLKVTPPERFQDVVICPLAK